jgi:hypothetical protein
MKPLYKPAHLYFPENLPPSGQRGGKTEKPESFCIFFKLRLPLPRSVRLFIEVIKISAFPDCALADQEGFIPAVNGNRIRSIGLKLDRISPRFLGRFNQFDRLFEILVMVCRKFGNDKGGAAGSDHNVIDLDVQHDRDPP